MRGVLLVLITLLMTGCASRFQMQGVNPLLRADSPLNTEQSKGEKVFWSGRIIHIAEHPEGRQLLVLAYPHEPMNGCDIYQAPQGVFSLLVPRRFEQHLRPGLPIATVAQLGDSRKIEIDAMSLTVHQLVAEQLHVWPMPDDSPPASRFSFGIWHHHH